MKILVTAKKIQSSLKGEHIYANKGDAVEMIGYSGAIGFYINLFTNETFPAKIEKIIEVEVDVMPIQQVEEKKPLKLPKNHNPNQINLF